MAFSNYTTFLSFITDTLSDYQIHIVLCLGLGEMSHYKSIIEQSLSTFVKIQFISEGPSRRPVTCQSHVDWGIKWIAFMRKKENRVWTHSWMVGRGQYGLSILQKEQQICFCHGSNEPNKRFLDSKIVDTRQKLTKNKNTKNRNMTVLWHDVC